MHVDLCNKTGRAVTCLSTSQSAFLSPGGLSDYIRAHEGGAMFCNSILLRVTLISEINEQNVHQANIRSEVNEGLRA